MAQADLKDFQENLARRLREAGETETTSRLALEAGGHRYLLRLDEAGEVLPVPALTPVPLCKPWFVGLANVRGNLVAATDLALFAGGEATARNGDARLVLFAEKFGARACLLVSRMLGLKNLTAFSSCEKDTDLPWVRGCQLEKNGPAGLWRELDMGALVRDENFLRASR
jgi:twitching motility protein PilI